MAGRDFVLQANVRENIIELMRVLGSVSRPLSLRAFAAWLAERIPAGHEVPHFKTVRRWIREKEPTEPDLVSIGVMAREAGVSFEDFALGTETQWLTIATDVVNHTATQIGRGPAPKTAPIATGFQKMSSKELEAESKKRRGKKRA